MTPLSQKMTKLYLWLKAHRKGQTVIEYAGAMIVAAIIVAFVILAAPNFATMVNTVVNNITNYFNSVTV